MIVSQEYLKAEGYRKLGSKFRYLNEVVNLLAAYTQKYATEITSAEFSSAGEVELDRLLDKLFECCSKFGGAALPNPFIQRLYYEISDAYRVLSRIQRIAREKKGNSEQTYKTESVNPDETINQFAIRFYGTAEATPIVAEDNPKWVEYGSATSAKVRVRNTITNNVMYEAWDIDGIRINTVNLASGMLGAAEPTRDLDSLSSTEAIKKFVERTLTYTAGHIPEFPWLGIPLDALIGTTILDYDVSEVRSTAISSLMQLGFFTLVQVTEVKFYADYAMVKVSLVTRDFQTITETYNLSLSKLSA